MRKRVVIIGGGSMLAITIDILEKQGLYTIVGIIDSRREIGSEVYGYKVIGRQEEIVQLLIKYNIEGGIITIGTNYYRHILKESIEKYLKEYGWIEDFEWINAIHPSCVIGSNVELGKGCLFMANTVINSESKIGNFVHMYTGAIIEHNNEFNDYSSISAKSSTGGFVKVSKFAAICMGCTLFDRVTIGYNSVVGSGSLVTKNVTIHCLVYGTPAKFIKNRKLEDKYLK